MAISIACGSVSVSVSPVQAKEQDGKRSRRKNTLPTTGDITDKDNLFVFILSYIVLLILFISSLAFTKCFLIKPGIDRGPPIILYTRSVPNL